MSHSLLPLRSISAQNERPDARSEVGLAGRARWYGQAWFSAGMTTTRRWGWGEKRRVGGGWCGMLVCGCAGSLGQFTSSVPEFEPVVGSGSSSGATLDELSGAEVVPSTPPSRPVTPSTVLPRVLVTPPTRPPTGLRGFGLLCGGCCGWVSFGGEVGSGASGAGCVVPVSPSAWPPGC